MTQCNSKDGQTLCPDAAVRTVFWPGQTTQSCDRHFKGQQRVASVMGFSLDSRPIEQEEGVTAKDKADVDAAVATGGKHAIETAKRIKADIDPISPLGTIAMGEMITNLIAAQYTGVRIALTQEVADEWLSSFMQVFQRKVEKFGTKLNVQITRKD